MKAYNNEIYNYVTSLDGWSHTATVRPPFRLSTKYAYKLMDRLFEDSKIYKVFWCKETDSNWGYSHLHLLLQHSFTDIDDMKFMIKLLNNQLGYKSNSMIVGYIDKVRDVKAYTRYMCKHITPNSAFGIMV
jgi:hypothetical protein